jgi:hypothetical protein
MNFFVEGFSFQPSQSTSSFLARSFDEEEMKEIQLPRTLSTPVPGSMASRSRSAPMKPMRIPSAESIDGSTATESNLDDSFATHSSGIADSNSNVTPRKECYDETPSSIEIFKEAVLDGDLDATLDNEQDLDSSKKVTAPNDTVEKAESSSGSELDEDVLNKTTLVVVAAEDAVQEVESYLQQNDFYSSPSRCQKVLEWSTVREVSDSLGEQETDAAKAAESPTMPEEKLIVESHNVRKAAADMENPRAEPSPPAPHKPRRAPSSRIAALQAKLNLQPGLKIPSSRLAKIAKLQSATTTTESELTKEEVNPTSSSNYSPSPSHKIKAVASDLESRLPFLQKTAPGKESRRESIAMSLSRIPSRKIQAAATDLAERLSFRQPKQEEEGTLRAAKFTPVDEHSTLTPARSEEFRAAASALSAKLSFRVPRTESEIDLDTRVFTDRQVFEEADEVGAKDCMTTEKAKDNSIRSETDKAFGTNTPNSVSTQCKPTPGSVLVTSVEVSLNEYSEGDTTCASLASGTKTTLKAKEASTVAAHKTVPVKQIIVSSKVKKPMDETRAITESDSFVHDKSTVERPALQPIEVDSHVFEGRTAETKEELTTKHISKEDGSITSTQSMSDMKSFSSLQSNGRGESEERSKKERSPSSTNENISRYEEIDEASMKDSVRIDFLQLEFGSDAVPGIKVVSKTAHDDASVSTEQPTEAGLTDTKTRGEERSGAKTDAGVLGEPLTNLSVKKKGKLRRSLKNILFSKKEKGGRPPLPKSPSGGRLEKKTGPSFVAADGQVENEVMKKSKNKSRVSGRLPRIFSSSSQSMSRRNPSILGASARDSEQMTTGSYSAEPQVRSQACVGVGVDDGGAGVPVGGSGKSVDKACRLGEDPTQGRPTIKRLGSKRATIRGDQVFNKRELFFNEEKKEEMVEDNPSGSDMKSTTNEQSYKNNPFHKLPSLSVALGESNVFDMFTDGLLCISPAGGSGDKKASKSEQSLQ